MMTIEAPFYNPSTIDFAHTGTGKIHFEEILAARTLAGFEYLFVEQDSTLNWRPFDSIKTSIINLTNKLLV